MEQENEKIEKSANESLNEFVGKEASQPDVNSVPVTPTPMPGEVAQPTQASVQQPVQAPVQAPAQPGFSGEKKQTEAKPMIDPTKIKVGRMIDGDGSKNKLEEGDFEEIQHGDKRIKISTKEYVIEKVSMQQELFMKKITAGEFTYSRDKTNKWIATRLEVTYKDSKYKSSLPNIKWFLDKYDPNSWNPSFKPISSEKEFQNQFVPVVSKLYYKFCIQFNKIAGDFGQQDFINELVGKKVILHEVNEEFDGKSYRRLDIHKFVG